MKGVEIYTHHNFRFLALLFVILFATVVFIFLGALESAFSKVGFSPITILLILVATLLGSAINIPISRLEATVPIMTEDYVSFFGLSYRIPKVVYGRAVTCAR